MCAEGRGNGGRQFWMWLKSPNANASRSNDKCRNQWHIF